MPRHLEITGCLEPHDEGAVLSLLGLLRRMEYVAARMGGRVGTEAPDDLAEFLFALEGSGALFRMPLDVEGGVDLKRAA